MSANGAVLEDELKEELTSRPLTAFLIMIAGLAILLLMMGVSISLGAAEISLGTVWTSLIAFDPSLTSHQIINDAKSDCRSIRWSISGCVRCYYAGDDKKPFG